MEMMHSRRISIQWPGLLAVLALVAVGIAGCDTEQKLEEPVKMHRSYYPVDSGNSYTFQVDSIFYDDFNETIDTFRSIEKFEIQGKADVNDTEQYRIKHSLNGPVKKSSIQFVKKTEDEVQLFTNNQRFLKMTFPVEENSEWDGHVYNSRESQTFQYRNVHQRYDGQYHQFDSTVTVNELDEGNLIERQLQQVVYAKNIGPVYRETLDLAFRGDSIPSEEIPWEEKANTGHILKYRLKKYNINE